MASLLTENVSVICQVVQHTDPRFPLLYFTIDSTALAAFVATAT